MAMIDVDKWQEIFHTLKQNKLRTGLTAFGVFWGIFMLVIMLGSGTGLQNSVYANFGEFSTNSMFIWAQSTTMPYKGFQRNRRYNFEYSDLAAIKSKIPEIDLIAPTVNGGGFRKANLVVHGLKKGEYIIFGKLPEEKIIDPTDIRMGRYLNEFDIKSKRKIAILGYSVYEDLFDKGEDPLNKYIRMNGSYFQVVGVTKSKHSGESGEQQDSEILIPFSTAQQIYNYANKVDHFSIVVKPKYEVAPVQKKVMAILAKNHDLHPNDEAAFGYFDLSKEFKKITGLFLGIKILIWIVGIGTLLAGVIGVSNIMLIIIKERTNEFGIKRALGATPRIIITNVLSEAVFLTTIAGNAGLMLGILALGGMNKIFEGDPEAAIKNANIDFKLGITALAIIILSGLIAGLIPSKRAVSIKPIEAIRTEN